jgi:chromate transporter
VLPSLVLIALSWIYMAFGQQPVVWVFFYGIEIPWRRLCCTRCTASPGKSLNPLTRSMGDSNYRVYSDLGFEIAVPLVVLSALLLGGGTGAGSACQPDARWRPCDKGMAGTSGVD